MVKHIENTTHQGEKVPYQPSWIDRLPIPAWLFYILCILMYVLVISITLWIDRSVPFGKIGSIPSISPFSLFAFLALAHYMIWIAPRSLQTFRPLLEVNDAEFSRIDYELTTIPRKLDWFVIPVSVFIAYPF